jgi:hypothetical protein
MGRKLRFCHLDHRSLNGGLLLNWGIRWPQFIALTTTMTSNRPVGSKQCCDKAGPGLLTEVVGPTGIRPCIAWSVIWAAFVRGTCHTHTHTHTHADMHDMCAHKCMHAQTQIHTRVYTGSHTCTCTHPVKHGLLFGVDC